MEPPSCLAADICNDYLDPELDVSRGDARSNCRGIRKEGQLSELNACDM